jgi:hypothetical protein
MNEIVKSGFLDTIFCKRNSITVDYDFRNPSFTGIIDSSAKTGYLFFNNQTGSIYQYSGSKIYDTGCPALSYSESARVSQGIVSGQFNGFNKFRILGNTASDDWTAFIVFKHLETGVFDKSKILFSTKDYDYSTSGFAVGINGCNRVFCEHDTPSSGKRIYTLNEELDNKNVLSVSKVNAVLSIGLHQFDDRMNKISSNVKYNIENYYPSNKMYIGGLGTSGVNYKNYSGTIDSFMLFNVGLGFPERNTFAKAFYCSSYDTGGYYTTTTSFISVTGIQLRSVPVATGVTGYVEVLAGTEIIDGGTVNKYAYSGVTGVFYSTLAVELTGVTTGQSNILSFNPPSGIYDYNYSIPFANSKVVLNANFDSSYKEVYSFSGINNDDLNLFPSFDNGSLKYSVLETGSGEFINFYLNGVAEPNVQALTSTMTGDFIVSGNAIDSYGFFDDNDSAVYDIIIGSGSITGLTTGDISAGSKTLLGSFVNNRDLYLNGNKLISGIDYSGVASNVVINTTNLIDGDIMLLPKHNMNLSRYTGCNDNNFDTFLNLFDEQIWVNGLRQMRGLDYLKVADFSLKYSTFSLEPFPDIIYNNDTGFFNV